MHEEFVLYYTSSLFHEKLLLEKQFDSSPNGIKSDFCHQFQKELKLLPHEFHFQS